jgi:hypothetical protein
MALVIEKYDNQAQALAALVEILHQQPYLFNEGFSIVVIRLKRYIESGNYFIVKDQSSRAIVGVATYAKLDDKNHWYMQNRITEFFQLNGGNNCWLIDYWWKDSGVQAFILNHFKSNLNAAAVWVDADTRELPSHRDENLIK